VFYLFCNNLSYVIADTNCSSRPSGLLVNIEVISDNFDLFKAT
jgi:hypothetical protein